jgi:hypothetical protein
MPLQIRRGTDAERAAMTQPLAAGELLYVTDEQKIYVGDNNTLGGIQITGYTDSDAKDATAAAFAGGSHTNVSFSYNTTTKSISASVDLSNYQGVIKASAFTGSVFADDGSTLNSQPLVDAISGTFNGNLVGNVTGNVTGNITGNIFTNLIDSANSSAITFTPSVIFNSDVTVENDLFANLFGNVIGNVIGDIQGNVVTSTGSNVIDISNRTFNGASVNIDANGSISSSGAVFTDIPFLVFTSVEPTGSLAPVSLIVQNNAGAGTAPFGLTRVRGSIASPTTVVNGDDLGQIANIGFDGTSFIPSATITAVVDNVVSTGVIPSKLEFKTSSALGVLATKATIKSTVVEFDVPPRLPVVADDTARTALVPTPTAGMMIFMSSGSSPVATNKVQVYDSTAWVNLH